MIYSIILVKTILTPQAFLFFIFFSHCRPMWLSVADPSLRATHTLPAVVPRSRPFSSEQLADSHEAANSPTPTTLRTCRRRYFSLLLLHFFFSATKQRRENDTTYPHQWRRSKGWPCRRRQLRCPT